jgi:uncharacterized protein YegL
MARAVSGVLDTKREVYMQRSKSMAASILASVVAVLAACAGGASSSSSPPLGPESSGGGESSDGGPAPGPAAGYAFPLTLTPLTPPQTGSASISLFYSVTDKNQVGVPGLTCDPPTSTNPNPKCDYVVKEDGLDIDLSESAFQAKPIAGDSLSIPTVLVLDLSGSVLKDNGIAAIKQSASAIVDAMLPEQSMAILTFADTVTTRVGTFTKDKAALKDAIQGITSSDGVSTNLYGALIQALGMWNDGFQQGGMAGKLTAGLAIVVTDGKDDAAAAKAQDVVKARGNKRVFVVGVGASDAVLDAHMGEIANMGMERPSSFADLTKAVSTITSKIQTLNHSIYRASYCSPKRAGQHEFVFTVKGNGAPASASCKPAVFSAGFRCSYPDWAICSETPAGSCCPPDAPYACLSTGICYRSADKAAAACGSSCIACGGTGQAPSGGLPPPGTSIKVSFTASGYKSTQCPEFRGPSCKALDACCATLPPGSTIATQCTQSALSANGEESQCPSQTARFCPTGPECQKVTACCKTFGDSAMASCWNAVWGQSEASCTDYLGKHCDGLGPSCSALRSCCAAKAEPARSSCETSFLSATSYVDPAQREAACDAARPSQSCP